MDRETRKQQNAECAKLEDYIGKLGLWLKDNGDDVDTPAAEVIHKIYKCIKDLHLHYQEIALEVNKLEIYEVIAMAKKLKLDMNLSVKQAREEIAVELTLQLVEKMDGHLICEHDRELMLKLKDLIKELSTVHKIKIL